MSQSTRCIRKVVSSFIAGKPPSYQTTCNPLKKLDFVGADLSANAVIQPMNIHRLYRPFRGQVRSH